MPVARRHKNERPQETIANIPLQSAHCCCMNCPTTGGDRMVAAFQPPVTEPDRVRHLAAPQRHLAQQGVLP
jgi:hypothetical protein